jgi:hypothetical protein
MPNQYQIKLNPLKYVFSIRGGRLLRFLVSSKGINDSLAISKKKFSVSHEGWLPLIDLFPVLGNTTHCSLKP